MKPAIDKASPVREVSIRDLVIRHPGQEGVTLMVVRAYFDGSGKAHDPNIDCVALAGYIGTEQVWQEFEVAWQGLREKYGVDFVFHTSASYGGQAPYDKLHPKARALMRLDLIEILREFNKKDFSAVAYAVSLPEYRAIQKTLPTPEYICGSSCLDALCKEVPAEHGLQVFYDRGESFLTELQDRWRNKKERARDPRLNRINVFSQVDDWRDYPALQAADYLAYCVRDPAQQLNLAMVTANLSFYGGYYGKEELERLTLEQPKRTRM